MSKKEKFGLDPNDIQPSKIQVNWGNHFLNR